METAPDAKRPLTPEQIQNRDLKKHGITKTQQLRVVTERSIYNKEYFSTDTLTGAAGRYQFDERLEQSLKLVARGTPSALMLIDLDHFKQVNDTFGHDAGDAVLKGVVAYLQSAVRTTDMVARPGGDELAVILNDSDGHSTVTAKKLVTGIKNLRFEGFPEGVKITASLGVVSLSATESPSEAYKRADKATYAAKEDGRNRFVVAKS